MNVTPEILSRALSIPANPSSDYDLNPDVLVSLPKDRKLRPAAVLIAIIERKSGWNMILTKRSPNLKHHPGQVAFPGGKVDKTDKTALAAALRESNEEIGLASDSVTVLGELDAHETVTGFTVSPFIGVIQGDFTAVPEQGEVEEVFEVPLNFLLELNNISVQARSWHGRKREYYTVPYGPYYIWGATARIIYGLAQRVTACR